MINERAGERVEIGGRVFVKTKPGLIGHAVFGPDETLDPGKYMVEFTIRPLSEYSDGRDSLCALVDIVSSNVTQLFEAQAFRSLIGKEDRYVAYFETDSRVDRVEYRLYVNGAEPLLIGDDPLVTRIEQPELAARMAAPPTLLREHRARVNELFASGIGIAILGEDSWRQAAAFLFLLRRSMT